MKKRHLLVLAVCAVLIASIGSPTSANDQQPARSELLQFTAGGHVIGFQPDRFYVATGTHALCVEFAGTTGVMPQSADVSEQADGTGKALPLSRVTYPNLYPGITLIYAQEHGGILTSTWTIAPSVQPDTIRLRYNVPVQLMPDGSLRLTFGTGYLLESAPMAWQEINGTSIPVSVTFAQQGMHDVGFAVGHYDPAYPLFIDPTLTWHTFLGAWNDEYGEAIAVDWSENIYVAGTSAATWGAPVTAHAGGKDAFAAKLNSSGERQWHTFLGSSYDEYGEAIAVDGSGNVYVTGYSGASWGTPVNAHAGTDDAFVVKLTNSGARQWHTFLGSSNGDYGRAIAVDWSGNVYVAGTSYASWSIPVTAHAGGRDAFAAKLNSSGTRQWHTFLGSSDDDRGAAIAVDGSGNVYVAGDSAAIWGTPVTAHAGDRDAFAAKLNSSGGRQWHTFLGSSSTDYGYAIAVGGNGNVYVAGASSNSWGTPVNAHAGSVDAFAAELNNSGVYQWHTFLGSSSYDYGYAIAVDGSGNVYVDGFSDATWGLPVTAHAGYTDAFVAKLNSSGERQWHTFMGSSDDDRGGTAIAFGGSGNVYVAGTSHASWGTPVTAHVGGYDAFAAKLTNSGVRQWHTFLGSSSTDSGYAIAVDGSGNVYVAGYSCATWGTPVTAFAGQQDAFVAKLSSNGTRQWHTFLGSWRIDSGYAIAVDGSGNVYVAGYSYATWGTPVTAFAGSVDAFVAKLSSSGMRQWHTFLGSLYDDWGSAIAVDGSGNVYVAGHSAASWGTPVTAHAGDYDAFAAKLNSNGVRQWHSFLGSPSTDSGYAIAVGGNGNVYVAGASSASWGTPVNAHAGRSDAFAAKLDSNGARQWHTFLGSSDYEFGRAIAVDGNGTVYVTGSSVATWGTTPVNAHAGNADAFVAKLTSSGARQWYTFLGSWYTDVGHAIAVDGGGNVHVSGYSDAPWGTPINAYAGGSDAFVASLNSNGVRQWHTFLGSSNTDIGRAIAVDGSGNVYVAGESSASWGTPVDAHAGGEDAFAAKISVSAQQNYLLWTR